MIAHLRGKLVSKSSTDIVVDCMGVGYRAGVSVITSEQLPEVGNEINVLTVLITREDSQNLYAFRDEAERNAFKLLVSISGIGAKIALGILSSVSIEQLQDYIFNGNLHGLTKLPGIGKKTAERILLELRDKIAVLGEISSSSDGLGNVKQEALSALITLGYSRAVAEKAVSKAVKQNDGDISAEEMIRIALKNAMM